MKVFDFGVFAIAAAIAGGCAMTGSGAGTPGAAPRVDVLLTDAPGDFDSVWVNVSKVEIEAADASWLTLADQPAKYDLLALQNDVTAALGGAQLVAGTYGQLRMIVDSASVVVGGVESSLKIASGAQTGIKIDLDQTIEDGMTYSITLDFDAGKSIKSTGQGFLMTPVISVKNFTGTVDDTGSGSDAGSDAGSDSATPPQ